jgi:hypothetical protein
VTMSQDEILQSDIQRILNLEFTYAVEAMDVLMIAESVVR